MTAGDPVDDLVLANRILAREGVLDAYGHVSIRHPDHPDRYLISRSRAPELVERADIMDFTLDGEALDPRGRTPYGERYIHGAIYEARPDVVSVVHNHAHETIPFGVTGQPIRPLWHLAGTVGGDTPVWDIRDHFGDTNMLVLNMEQGRDLAAALGGRNAILMRGHGCAVVGTSLKQAVFRSIYLQVNARMQLQAMGMGAEITFLSDGEIEKTGEVMFKPFSLDRAWEYWARRAMGGEG